MALKSNSSRTGTVTRADLASAVYDRATLSRKDALELVEMTIREIADTLVRGEDVKLASFGAFLVRSKRERIGRNPRTGVEAKIVARRVVMFKASQILRDRVSGGGASQKVATTRNADYRALPPGGDRSIRPSP